MMNESTTSANPPVDNVLKTTQNAIALTVAFGTILTSVGFIIVNASLSNYTDIQGYNISSTQFLAAGIGLLVFDLISLALWLVAIMGISTAFKNVFRITIHKSSLFHLPLFIFVTLFMVAGILNALQIQMPKPAFITDNFTFSAIIFFANIGAVYVVSTILRILEIDVNVALRNILSTEGFMLLAVVFLCAVATGYIYGATIYRLLPRYVGGGLPQTATIIMRDDVELAKLQITKDTTDPSRTGIIWILAELNDGLLIVDSNTGKVYALKNDTILAIVDDVAYTQPTPTP